jgi:hypothetical protein
MLDIIKHLEAMRGQYIALSLWPDLQKTIQPEGNILKINEGRGGVFYNVSEAFYDELVNIYDSRYKN